MDDLSDYQKFVYIINTKFTDSSMNTITLDTTGHPPIESLMTQTDVASMIVNKKELSSLPKAGIGLQLFLRNNQPVVVVPVDGTPASRNGIFPSDTIVSINDVKTEGLSLDSIVMLFRGEPGTTVNVNVKRGDEFLSFPQITREIIKLKSVEMPLTIADNIGYIRLKSFSSDTKDELENACEQLIEQDHKLIIIDIRNNHGGLLPASVESASLFLKKNILVVKTRGVDPLVNKSFYSYTGDFRKVKLIIVMNQYTQCGAELFVNSLKQNERALVIGSKSEGFGTIQSLIPLNDTCYLKLTTAHFFGPDGTPVHNVGITPDIVIDNSKDFHEMKTSTSMNQIPSNDDIQLKTAIVEALKMVSDK